MSLDRTAATSVRKHFCGAAWTHRALVAGEVKRCLARGTLFSYWICCPRCSKTFAYMRGFTESSEWTRSEYRWTDEDDEERSVMVDHPVSVTGEAQCYGCGGSMRVSAGDIQCL